MALTNMPLERQVTCLWGGTRSLLSTLILTLTLSNNKRLKIEKVTVRYSLTSVYSATVWRPLMRPALRRGLDQPLASDATDSVDWWQAW